MYFRGIAVAALLVAAQASACLQDHDEPAPVAELGDTEQATLFGSFRLQAGKDLVALGVTDDNFALYWSASAATVYASPMFPFAPKFPVATGVTAAPITLIRGRVAMIWTDQPFLGNLQGVLNLSRLVVWSALTGPRVASAASLPPQQFAIQAPAAVRPDGFEVVFTSNVSDDGATGDIVRASTDLKQVTTLLSGVQMSLGPCPPHVGYDRLSPLGTARVVVSACAPDATTATLSRWTHDDRVDLTTNMRPGIWWTSDERGEHVLTQLSDNSPAVFTLDNAMTIVDDHRTATGWITRDGTVFQTPLKPDRSAREIYRIRLGATPSAERVTTLPASSGLQFANHLPFGVPYANVSTVPTSRSGALVVAFTAFNDTSGFLTDSLRIDARATDAAPVASSAAPVSLPAFEIATRDERFNLFHAFPTAGDVTHSVLFAGSADGSSRQVSQGETTLGVFGLTGSRIAFADRVTAPLLDGNIDATGDIVAVDVGAPAAAPTTIARGARAHFFVTPERDRIVYTTNAGANPGLFVRFVVP